MNCSYNTISFGKVCIHLREIDSTNNYATKLLQKQPLPIEGTLVAASHQYNGRGQRGSNWQSEADQNMTISILLYPKQLLARQQFALSQAMALGIYHFIHSLVPIPTHLSIKWPNDI